MMPPRRLSRRASEICMEGGVSPQVLIDEIPSQMIPPRRLSRRASEICMEGEVSPQVLIDEIPSQMIPPRRLSRRASEICMEGGVSPQVLIDETPSQTIPIRRVSRRGSEMFMEGKVSPQVPIDDIPSQMIPPRRLSRRASEICMEGGVSPQVLIDETPSQTIPIRRVSRRGSEMFMEGEVSPQVLIDEIPSQMIPPRRLSRRASEICVEGGVSPQVLIDEIPSQMIPPRRLSRRASEICMEGEVSPQVLIDEIPSQTISPRRLSRRASEICMEGRVSPQVLIDEIPSQMIPPRRLSRRASEICMEGEVSPQVLIDEIPSQTISPRRLSRRASEICMEGRVSPQVLIDEIPSQMIPPRRLSRRASEICMEGRVSPQVLIDEIPSQMIPPRRLSRRASEICMEGNVSPQVLIDETPSQTIPIRRVSRRGSEMFMEGKVSPQVPIDDTPSQMIPQRRLSRRGSEMFMEGEVSPQVLIDETPTQTMPSRRSSEMFIEGEISPHILVDETHTIECFENEIHPPGSIMTGRVSVEPLITVRIISPESGSTDQHSSEHIASKLSSESDQLSPESLPPDHLDQNSFDVRGMSPERRSSVSEAIMIVSAEQEMPYSFPRDTTPSPEIFVEPEIFVASISPDRTEAPSSPYDYYSDDFKPVDSVRSKSFSDFNEQPLIAQIPPYSRACFDIYGSLSPSLGRRVSDQYPSDVFLCKLPVETSDELLPSIIYQDENLSCDEAMNDGSIIEHHLVRKEYREITSPYTGETTLLEISNQSPIPSKVDIVCSDEEYIDEHPRDYLSPEIHPDYYHGEDSPNQFLLMTEETWPTSPLRELCSLSPELLPGSEMSEMIATEKKFLQSRDSEKLHFETTFLPSEGSDRISPSLARSLPYEHSMSPGKLLRKKSLSYDDIRGGSFRELFTPESFKFFSPRQIRYSPDFDAHGYVSFPPEHYFSFTFDFSSLPSSPSPSTLPPRFMSPANDRMTLEEMELHQQFPFKSLPNMPLSPREMELPLYAHDMLPMYDLQRTPPITAMHNIRVTSSDDETEVPQEIYTYVRQLSPSDVSDDIHDKRGAWRDYYEQELYASHNPDGYHYDGMRHNLENQEDKPRGLYARMKQIAPSSETTSESEIDVHAREIYFPVQEQMMYEQRDGMEFEQEIEKNFYPKN